VKMTTQQTGKNKVERYFSITKLAQHASIPTFFFDFFCELTLFQIKL
jgi:hypothetical protein